MTKAPLIFTLTLRGDQVEEIADLVENKLSMVDVVDREDAAVARRLNDILDKINALGPLRERRVLRTYRGVAR
jgi:hypothetical protein